MPNPRDVLEKLPLADLKGLADSAGLDVADPRSAASFAGALEKLGVGHLEVLLASLPRAILKDVCPEARRQHVPRLKSIPVRDSSGDELYISVDSLKGLLGLVQMNVVELHPWGSRTDRLERPDRMFFDLDPVPDVPWEKVVEGALLLRRVLEDMSMTPHVKTTGGKGLHVLVHLAPEQDWDHVKAFSRAIAVELARAQPERYVAVASKAARKGRIFLDYLRNARGATAVAPSVRARAGAPFSMPVSWKDLESLPGPSVYRLQHGEAPKKPAKRDPWSSFLTSADSLRG